MKRQIIEIDENLCNGCGDCIPGCPEGALQIIDGKARLISDLFCDGLGACIGDCPTGAIKTIEREAEAYDEAVVMENIIKAGPYTIKAHLKHLKDHQQVEYFSQAVTILNEKNIPLPDLTEAPACQSGGCPGSAAMSFDKLESSPSAQPQNLQSELRQWPIQLHLMNPNAPYLKNSDLLIAADCAPFAYANFHQKFLKGKILINFCPKLDQGLDVYVQKLAEIFANQNIKSVTAVRMEVPCCGGIEQIIQKAMEISGKFIMTRVSVLSVQGELV